MHIRKVTKEGRVNIPVEYLKRLEIKENDLVEVRTNSSNLMIRKHKNARVCDVTGKASDDVVKIGDANISLEGIEIIKNQFKTKDN